jgi:hypothetical protein
MKTDDVVVRIDLAPKLKRPLSLWNPLDYLRLLYWVFYFPQALRWYRKTFENSDFSDYKTFQQYWQYLQKSSVQKSLILQSFFVSLIMDFGGAKILEVLGFNINWLGVMLGTLMGVMLLFLLFIETYVILNITFSMITSIVWGVTMGTNNVFSRITLIIVLGIALSVLVNEIFTNKVFNKRFTTSVAEKMGFGVSIGSILCIISGVFTGMVLGLPSGLAMALLGLSAGVISGSIISIACGTIALRVDDCFFRTIIYFVTNNQLHLWHISPIPITSISKKVTKWLQMDWENGLYNANQILEYTSQFTLVLQAINFVLSTTSSKYLLPKISLLAQRPFHWDIIRFSSASWSNKLKFDFVNGLFILPRALKKRLNHNLSLELRTNTPARAAAAGFWYLHEKDSARALQAFLELQSFPYGQEMCLLAQVLMLCDQPALTENPVSGIAEISLSLIPDTPHLHPESWPIIAGFQQVITNIQIVKTSNSRYNKSLALNRALGQLDKIIKQSNQIITAEKDLMIKIATDWQSALLTVTSEIGEIVILKPVVSPYTIGDPVEGDAFVGREDIINQLSELWRQNKSVQSVVLYGHRRMGKTSILRNINNRLGDNVRLAYVNMLLKTNPQGEADILMFICDQIKIATGVAIPTNAEFSAFPETTCLRYIQEVLERMDANEDPLPRRERGQETTLNDPNPEASHNAPATLLPTWEKGLGDEGISMPSSEPPSPIAPLPQKISSRKLIIAIDEFEQIDELIAAQKISPSFLSFLRGLVQISPQIAFAFAGLHTLEERVANYSDPFFASFIPIPVGFLSLGATRQLLANPADPDFPLDYTPETLDNIYQLTAGQPYLTQLVGFQLVRHYNQQVFESGHTRDPIFTIDDLNTVIQDPVFFDRGRYYFTGVWNQASQDVPHQQTILTALAPHLTGLSLSELSTVTNLTLTELNAALKVLERHDVAVCEQEKWRISIELFRRWVANKLYAQP